jgi:hypothetical protein
MVLIFLFLPIIAFASGQQESPNSKRFRYLCEHTEDPALRQQYCHLLKEQKKAEAVADDFLKSDKAIGKN